MLLRHTVTIERPPGTVFELIADTGRYQEFLHGITLWEPCSDQLEGTGARFRVLMQVAAIQAGGIVEVDDWVESRTIAWSHRSGVQQRGRWSIDDAGNGTSRVTLELGYDLAGPFAWLVERAAARIIGRNLEASLLAVRRIVEYEGSDGF